MRSTKSIVVAVFLLSTSGDARAVWLGLLPHEVDPALAQVDTVPPLAPVVQIAWITRGQDSAKLANGSTLWVEDEDCGSVHVRVIRLEDNATPVGQMGIRVVARHPWAVIRSPGYDFRPWVSRSRAVTFTLVWNDGRTDLQEAISETLFVYAVDLAGNVSIEADTLLVVDPGSP